MAVRIKFGGPELPAGSKTWYDKINEDGTFGGQVFVYHGDVVDAAEIGKIVNQNGRDALIPNWQRYVEAGQACIEAEVTSEA